MSTVKQPAIEKNGLPEKGSTVIERGIYRINYPSHKGIRVYLKFKDIEYQKVFSTGTRSERKALAEARKWRKERLQEIKNSPEANNPLKRKMKNNTSGITGVRRSPTAWSATWVENRVQKHRSFAVGRFGEDEAFKLACQARADAETRLYGGIFQDELKPPVVSEPKKKKKKKKAKRK
ncbi:MAG: AP2 domain-containing protein [Pyrinomonadaceae bacterium]|nr:AP2 domain-containing protein [Pyrinomonadaceae bacterium]